jgi:DNA gyrase subunit A
VLAQAVLPLEPEERIEALVDTRDYESFKYMVIVTKRGKVKRTAFREYDSRNTRLVAISLTTDDEVVAVRSTDGNSDILLFTRQGLGIRFSEDDIRPMGRSTRGVRGIKLDQDDEVVGAGVTLDGNEMLLVTSGGYGKRTKVAAFRPQKRDGRGLKAINLSAARGKLVGAHAVTEGSEVFVVSSEGIAIRMETDSISRQGRYTIGVKVMNLPEGARVSSFALVPKDKQ